MYSHSRKADMVLKDTSRKHKYVLLPALLILIYTMETPVRSLFVSNANELIGCKYEAVSMQVQVFRIFEFIHNCYKPLIQFTLLLLYCSLHMLNRQNTINYTLTLGTELHQPKLLQHNPNCERTATKLEKKKNKVFSISRCLIQKPFYCFLLQLFSFPCNYARVALSTLLSGR